MDQPPPGQRTAAHLLANAARFERLARSAVGNEGLRAELLALAASAQAEAALLRSLAIVPPAGEEPESPAAT